MASNTIATTEGQLSGVSGRFTLVVGRWNSFVVEHLLEGAIDTLKRHGINEDQLHIVRAPGPLKYRWCVRLWQSAVIATRLLRSAPLFAGYPHFEHVAGECTKGIAQVSLDSGVPIAFGVLTVDSIEQAIERSGTKAGNKGAEAAMSALEMVSLLGALKS